MKDHFVLVKDYLLELGFEITQEDLDEELFIVNDEESGIVNLLVDCEDPILIVELFLLNLSEVPENVYVELLQKNRELVHGAFALDETGTMLVFRDTLQLENLDLNELEGTINALKLMLAEYSHKLVSFAQTNAPA